MEYRRLGRTDLKVSVVGFGAISTRSPENLKEMLVVGKEMGINHVDTARGYPKSEERLGVALSGNREDFHIISRTKNRGAGQVTQDIAESLSELQTDYIDVYQVHELGGPEDLEQVLGNDGAARQLQEAKKEGKIRFTGLSSHHLDSAAKALATGLFDTLVLPFSPVEYSARHLQLLKICKDLDVGVTAMKPMSGGNFVHNVSANISFILQHEIAAVIPGMKSVEELRENALAGSDLRVLKLDELDALMAAAEELGESFCRRCGYCLPCEEGVPIPGIMMSDAYLKGNKSAAFMFGGKVGLDHFKSALERCTQCGECATRCPYQLPIPDLMPEKVAFFEKVWMENFEK